MSNGSTVVGYLVGGIPLLIGGMSLLRAMEWVGVPAGIGVVIAAVGVAETLGTLCKWMIRGGKKHADAARGTLEQRQRHQSLHEALALGGIALTSGCSNHSPLASSATDSFISGGVSSRVPFLSSTISSECGASSSSSR
jgi:hypothetical protein